MSTEEKDAQIGRLIRERKDAELSLAHLTEKSKGIGKNLIELGTALRDYPSRLTFPGESTDTRFRADKLIDFDLSSLEEIKSLVRSLHEQQLTIWGKTDTLKNLGID